MMAIVLIVEDEPTYAQPTRKALESKRYRVKIAPSIAKARAALKKQLADAIILDIMFRTKQTGAANVLDSTGYDYLRELKADPVTKDIPVMIYTVRMDARIEQMCLEAGAAAFIHKMAGGVRIREVLETLGVVPDKTNVNTRKNVSC